VKERRRQLRHPSYVKPELIAEGPNQVWSWDISKLMGPAKWTYFYLYVIIDIFSRRVVGWCVADSESAALFKPLFEDAAAKHDVPPGQLTLHADRGPSMKAKATALLLADLGVTKSHSRPYIAGESGSLHTSSSRLNRYCRRAVLDPPLTFSMSACWQSNRF
jgi:putative transposase